MGLQIEDGKGTGRTAAVDSDNRLSTTAVVSSIEHHVNHAHENAYNASFDNSPTLANDAIFYLKNDSDMDLTVEGFYLSTTGTLTGSSFDVFIEINTSDTPSGTTVTPTNMNAGSGKIADVTCLKGSDLGITNGNGTEVARGRFTSAFSTSFFNFEQDLILPKGKSLALFCNDAALTVQGHIPFNFHSHGLI